jgi:glycosyltransferase involved in cell wall biosynthesis
MQGPWGGGNQFLKALRSQFLEAGVYEEDPEAADVILFNSYPFRSEHLFGTVSKLKRQHGTVVIHRVDGPISRVRGKDREIDEIIFRFNDLFVDGTIFQSSWSREKNTEMGMKEPAYETVILNAPDPALFNRSGKREPDQDKIRLIATSWSDNMRKGFDVYRFLDENLDLERFDMTFVGRSPVKFKNIRWIKPVPSHDVASILKAHDIFVTASRDDPCSNSLIEALHCGLPAAAKNDGGHPEIIGEAGEFFEDKTDVMDAIEKILANYQHYQSKINVPSIEDVGQSYYQFAQSIHQNCLDGVYTLKKPSFFTATKFLIGRRQLFNSGRKKKPN